MSDFFLEGNEDPLRRYLADFCRSARLSGLPPEKVVIEVKQLVFASESRARLAEEQRELLTARAVTMAIEEYFVDSPPVKRARPADSALCPPPAPDHSLSSDP